MLRQHPHFLDIDAHERIRARLAEAQHAALAAQLPRSGFGWSFFAPVNLSRRWLAHTLRGLAVLLDPSVVCEPSLVVARTPR